MRTKRRISNAAQRVTGNVKVAVGRLSGNRRVKAQGRGDQMKARAKQATENVRAWGRKRVRS